MALGRGTGYVGQRWKDDQTSSEWSYTLPSDQRQPLIPDEGRPQSDEGTVIVDEPNDDFAIPAEDGGGDVIHEGEVRPEEGEPDYEPEEHVGGERLRDPEEDEDEIEVAVEDGVGVKRKKGTLKGEADTMEHMLTYRYSNPCCDSCVRAKMRRLKTRRGAFKRPPKKWGDVVTMDFILPERVDSLGFDEDKEVLTIRDLYSRMMMAYTTTSRDTDEVVRCIRHFMGRRKIQLIYSDEAPEFVKACKGLRIEHDTSLPGRKKNNSLAERTNLYIIDQVSTCPLAAGLPPCYWSFALQTTCHLMNVEDVDGESAWAKGLGEEFNGPKIPFGALVDFMPSPTRDDTHKFAPRSKRGVFAGYVINSSTQTYRMIAVIRHQT